MTRQPAPDSRPAGGYTVLVVDDEEPVRRLAVRMLTWAGYEAIEARHGREALDAIEGHSGPVHLVLTDIKMPGMNGRELGRFVEERWPGKPILYMSGSEGHEDVSQYLVVLRRGVTAWHVSAVAVVPQTGQAKPADSTAK